MMLACIPAYGADLTITVTHLRSAKGDVHMALYDTPETFPDSDGMLHKMTVLITSGPKQENAQAQGQAQDQAQATFKNLQPGAYAVAVFHDENGNHEFDQGLFGIPLEDFAFSNNARVFFAPPSFKDAAFQLTASQALIIPMNDGSP